jgi:hypothetical protein
VGLVAVGLVDVATNSLFALATMQKLVDGHERDANSEIPPPELITQVGVVAVGFVVVTMERSRPSSPIHHVVEGHDSVLTVPIGRGL